MQIPILELKREYQYLKKDIDQEIRACLNTQKWILGPKVCEFEKKVAEYLGLKYTIGVASGTDALLLSLSAFAFKLKKKERFDSRDEIITTPFTFIATAESILRSGARPVFVDIDPATFNIDPSEIEKAITKHTVGILPVHLYGSPCDMDKICRIAKKHNLFMLEDVAQSFGAEYRREKVGSFGDSAAFSFFPSKNLGGFGDAGLVGTDNKATAGLIKSLRDHGQNKHYNAAYLGFNSRLDSIQAAVLLAKLKHIDEFNRKRIKIANTYNQAFKNIPQIQTPASGLRASDLGLTHIYHLYTLRIISRRAKLLKYLHSKGIGTRVYYPFSLDRMRAFKGAKCQGNLSETRKATSEVLTLPIHPFLKTCEIEYVIKSIRSFYQKL